MRSLIAGIFVFALVAISSCCKEKEIVCGSESGNNLTVAFGWDNAPDAQVEGMTLFFFPQNNSGKMWRFDISGMAGGAVELPYGKYRMIAVNNDLPGVRFSGFDSFDTFAAEARSAGVDSLLSPTGVLYRSVVTDIDFTPCGVTYADSEGCDKECPRSVIRCSPDTASTLYNIHIGAANGLEGARSVSARLCGVALFLTLCDDALCTSAGAVQASLIETATYPLAGTTSGFGPATGADCMTLWITVLKHDGTAYTKSFDVTDQVMNSAAIHSVDIYIDEIDVPDDGGDESGEDVGMDVGVDGWTVIEIDL